MSKITIQRAGGFIGSSIDLKILIDGNEVGLIKRRQTKEFHVAEGRHTLKIEYGWLIKKSREVEFDSSPDKIFSVSFTPVFWWVIIYFFIALIAKHTSIGGMTLIPSFGGSYQLLLMMIPGLLVLVYYETLGRKKLLVLRESKELNLSLL